MKTLDYQGIVLVTYRFYPPLCALLMLHHVVALIAGYNVCIHEFFIDSSVVAMLMQIILSKAFRFCIWHRACIIYTYAVSLCIHYERSVGFGAFRDPLRWTVLVVGLVVLIAFIVRCLRQPKTNNIFK